MAFGAQHLLTTPSGFCSREQVYRPENCGVCRAVLVGKAGSGFWEGGKGTRNKVLMSRKGMLPIHLMVSSYADELQIHESINAWVRQNQVLRAPRRNDGFGSRMSSSACALGSTLGVMHFVQAHKLASTCYVASRRDDFGPM
jgi:hypothetical protein